MVVLASGSSPSRWWFSQHRDRATGRFAGRLGRTMRAMSPSPKPPAKPATQGLAKPAGQRAAKAVSGGAAATALTAAGAAALAGPGEHAPLNEQELDTLQALMDSLPDTLEPLDTVMIDGYLCGVLLQPQPVPEERWLAHIADVEGRTPPKRFDAALMRRLVLRRYSELNRAIAQRQWFDPWVYELDDQATPSETVLPWVAGFATAVDLFTTLMDRYEGKLLEPLATLYRHLDPDDLEDAEELLAEIETLAPPETLVEAVEDLVRSVLLMADVSRPQPTGRQTTPHPALARRAASATRGAAGHGPVAKAGVGLAGPRGPAGRPRGGR